MSDASLWNLRIGYESSNFTMICPATDEKRTFRFMDKLFEFVKARDIDLEKIKIPASDIFDPLNRNTTEEFFRLSKVFFSK